MNILAKLKKKFFIIAVSMVGVVLLIVFSSIFLYSYRVLKITTDDYLNKAVSEILMGGRITSVPFFMGQDSKSQPTFVYEIGKENIFIASNINRKLKGTALDRIVKEIEQDKSEKGYLIGEEFKYQVVKTTGSNYILFLVNISPQIKMIKLLSKSLISAFFFTMIIIGLISKYLIDKALEPVEQSWDDQKQFIADASHELKTPLTVIMANLKILKKYDNYDRNQSKWIENTELEAKRMKDLVEEMLFLARRDAGNMITSMEEFNFTELVEEVALTFESIAFENDLNIVPKDVEDNLMIKGDRGQLKRLVIILIDNACKYSKPHNNIYLNVVKKDKKVEFSVTSIGTPIDSKYADKIFERFVRESKSRARDREGGYGLGLAIANSIVETHHGRIYWKNFEDRGNTFVVELPS